MTVAQHPHDVCSLADRQCASPHKGDMATAKHWASQIAPAQSTDQKNQAVRRCVTALLSRLPRKRDGTHPLDFCIQWGR